METFVMKKMYFNPFPGKVDHLNKLETICAIYLWTNTRCDQQVPRLIFLLGCGYTSGHHCMHGRVLELTLSLGQGMIPSRLSVLCELRSKRVVYLRLVIVRALRDVGRARAARVHQVLCETGKKWCGDM